MRRTREEYIDRYPTVRQVLESYGVPVPNRTVAYIKVRCPFHEDRSPSSTVNEDRNMFYCFACDISTTAIGMIMRKESCDLASARQIAEERFGPGGSGVYAEPPSQRERLPLLGREGNRRRPDREVPHRTGGGGLLS